MSPPNNNARNVPNLLGAANIYKISEDGEIVGVITGLATVAGITITFV